MNAVAEEAGISRPGLYYLFASKEELFRAAVLQALGDDVLEVARLLSDDASPLADRLLAAFDRWAGRYVGPFGIDAQQLVAANPALIGAAGDDASCAYRQHVEDAVTACYGVSAAHDITSTLLAASIGLKHQAEHREEYLSGMRTAIRLLLP